MNIGSKVTYPECWAMKKFNEIIDDLVRTTEDEMDLMRDLMDSLHELRAEVSHLDLR